MGKKRKEWLRDREGERNKERTEVKQKNTKEFFIWSIFRIDQFQEKKKRVNEKGFTSYSWLRNSIII